MAERELTNGTAVVIGLLVAVGVSIVLLLIAPGAGYFTPFIFTAVKAAFPLGIIGAFIGKYFSETRIGILLGAVIMLFVGILVTFSLVGMLALD